jgi:uncharacterized DUF497 family protein
VITYDEAKRRANIQKHGIDFAECGAIFDAPMQTKEDDRLPYGEIRLRSLGLFFARVVVLIWTEREEGPHIISCRWGSKDETKRYFSAIR